MKTLPNFTYKTIDLTYQSQRFQLHLHSNGIIHFGHFDCFDQNKTPVDGMSKIPYLALSEVLPTLKFHGVHQTHSCNITKVYETAQQFSSTENSDALVTFDCDQLLYIKTADCIPLILFDDQFTSILHLGHKGFFDGLAQKFLTSIPKDNKSHLKAYIGPSIQKCCFEVSEEFLNEKLDRSLINESQVFREDTKAYLSLSTQLITILRDFGIKSENILVNNICTKCNDNWFSHRANQTKHRISHLIFKTNSRN